MVVSVFLVARDRFRRKPVVEQLVLIFVIWPEEDSKSRRHQADHVQAVVVCRVRKCAPNHNHRSTGKNYG
jgi:hypothetical protein